MNIQLHLDIDKPKRYKIFVHNKGQMLFPRHDYIFGSHSIHLDWDPEEITIKPYKRVSFRQHYELGRIHSISIDTADARCDSDNKANTTECISTYLEDSIGCSMGLAGGKSETERLIQRIDSVL